MDLSSYWDTINRILLKNEKKSVLEFLAIKVPVYNGHEVNNIELKD